MTAVRAIAVLIATAGGLAGCGHTSRSLAVSTTAPAEYPCVLRDPKTLGPDFLVRQSLAIHTRRDGKPIDGQFDAILQKQGDTLTIVGFGPMNVKAFTLTHRGDQIEFQQYMGPELPFSPRNVVVDVHRVFFKRLPPPAQPGFSGTQRGELDGETVEETWRDGELRAAVFTRPPGATGTRSDGQQVALRGAIRIELGPGCTPAACEPETATLHNEWFDYTLTAVNEGYEKL
jgi:hypothetical protein